MKTADIKKLIWLLRPWWQLIRCRAVVQDGNTSNLAGQVWKYVPVLNFNFIIRLVASARSKNGCSIQVGGHILPFTV